MRPECYFCHTKTIERLIEKHSPNKEIAEEFIFSIHNLLGKNKSTINPILATEIHRIAKEKLNIEDLYAIEKKEANSLLLSKYSYWRNFIDKSKNSFQAAVKLAVIGNIIDFGAHSLQGDLEEQIHKLYNTPLKTDKTEELKIALENAKSVLYLGDNAGEVFFDRLFIETIKHNNITFAVRGFPVINDLTIDDAKQVGIDALCEIVPNGYDAPSTLLQHCSKKFIEKYESADLVISKGQGNFEGLMNEKHPNTFFLLIAKCKPIGELLGVEKGSLVVTKFEP